jgi:phospholipase/carboxylesterase
MRLRLLLVGLLLASCSECSQHGQPPERPRPTEKIRWPASAAIDLEAELAATAIRLGDVTLAPGEAAPESAPGVKVREQVVNDIYLLEVVLGEAEFDDPLPLVVLLHGRGDHPRVPGGPFMGVPTPMRLILPQGPQRLGKGYTWVPVSITEGRPALLGQSLNERAGQLAHLISTLLESRPTLGKPVVAGFSQGGMLALTLALHHPALFSAAFPLASWVPPGLVPRGGPPPDLPLPIRSVHGAADTIVPLPPTRELFVQLQELGWDVALHEFEGVGHLMSAEMNGMLEGWLEQALHAIAPALEGGLGEAGPEPDAYEPYEVLDDETIRAIEREGEGPIIRPMEPNQGPLPQAQGDEEGDEEGNDEVQAEGSAAGVPPTEPQ